MAFLLAVYHLILTTFSFTMCGCEGVFVFRAVEGGTVHLPCHSLPENIEQGSVKWTKNSTTICGWSFNKSTGSFTRQCNPHFTLNIKSFTLSIENVELSDSGNYSCETTIMIPPPTLDNISSVRLQVAGLSLQLQNGSNDTCVHLICSLESQTPELVNFTWTREGHGSLYSFTSYVMNSELHLCKPDWSDGDTITCHGSFSSARTPHSRNITLDFSDEGCDPESRQDFPVVCVAIFSIFIIAIVSIWILFCIFKYQKMKV